MNNPYDVHSWSIQYREERLREARTGISRGGCGRAARRVPGGLRGSRFGERAVAGARNVALGLVIARKKGCEMRLRCGIETRPPSLSLVRGGRLHPSGRDVDALPIVRRPLERGRARNPAEHIRPARCPRKPRLRMRPPGDAAPARRDVPLPGLRLGGPPGRCSSSPSESDEHSGLAYWSGWAGRPLWGVGQLRRQPEPGEVGGPIRQARLLQGPPRGQRGSPELRIVGTLTPTKGL